MLSANPRLSSWVRVNSDGTVAIRSGKVELGQGILTALAQIAAEELDVRLDRVRMLAAGTDLSPNEGFTAGSLSVQNSGAAVRQACAEVRAIFLYAASAALGVEPDRLEIRDGEISGLDPSGRLRRTSYGELADETSLDRDASGNAWPKSPADYRIVGTSVARLDLPDKLTGRPRFIHDLVLDGMLYGRVVRPPSRGAELVAVDSARVAALPGVVAVARDGNFLGVVAEREEVAVQAAELLRAGAVWREEPTLPEQARLNEFLTSAPAETTVLVETTEPAEPAARTLSASFSRPYLAHASIGPSCALALVEGDRLSVWSHSQGVFQLRDELGRALHKPTDRITVQHVEAAGCYGHNGADDAALDAVLLAGAVPGRPVQLVWSRQDELGWAPFGPAAVVRVSADVGAAGDVVAWRHEIWGNGHAGRPGLMDSVALLAAAHTADASSPPISVDIPLSRGGGAGRNAVPGYAFPAYQVVSHRLLSMPLRTSSLRSLGAHLNVFAAESFVDELADAAGADPVEYRLRHLADARGRAVIEAVARRADWSRRPAGDSVGCGIAYARYKNSGAYCAVVAEVEAEHELRVRRLTIAVDAGLVVNPDGVVNQIEGGAIQATSWTVKEQVSFDRLRVTSDSWETYPILRFTEVPAVDVEVLHRPDEPSLGAGEASQGPTAAAIANALSAAIGVRVRQLPLTSENIVAAIDGSASTND
jgi:CO/xanthine dehydrogenase Mo-binding subunit